MDFIEMPPSRRHFSFSIVVEDGPTGLQEAGLTAAGSFVPVKQGDRIDLTDLVVKGYMEDEGFCDGLVYVQTLDAAGRNTATYTWMDDGMGG